MSMMNNYLMASVTKFQYHSSVYTQAIRSLWGIVEISSETSDDLKRTIYSQWQSESFSL